MSTCSHIPNEVPLIVKDAIARDTGGGLPTAHHAHPHDPTLRTALCGDPMLGIESFGAFQVCLTCQALRAAGDWAPLPRQE